MYLLEPRSWQQLSLVQTHTNLCYSCRRISELTAFLAEDYSYDWKSCRVCKANHHEVTTLGDRDEPIVHIDRSVLDYGSAVVKDLTSKGRNSRWGLIQVGGWP